MPDYRVVMRNYCIVSCLGITGCDSGKQRTAKTVFVFCRKNNSHLQVTTCVYKE
jgi:hypothetical protein